MSERDSENFDIDEEFVAETEDSTDYDGILAKVDKRVRTQGKRGKAGNLVHGILPCWRGRATPIKDSRAEPGEYA